ncbi:MAG: adenylyltransferase/cytidyltransferase family protein, partial [Alphaproteobacteria bacterium]|nr:adenylyltransferase/cytidyltransferase family protein [Alphaproteobacteria bacterium]
MAKKYGFLLGRFQPLHKGHQYLIDQIKERGYEPILFLGSSNFKRDRDTDPLTFHERVEMIRLIYPDLSPEAGKDGSPPGLVPFFDGIPPNDYD